VPPLGLRVRANVSDPTKVNELRLDCESPGPRVVLTASDPASAGARLRYGLANFLRQLKQLVPSSSGTTVVRYPARHLVDAPALHLDETRQGDLVKGPRTYEL